MNRIFRLHFGLSIRQSKIQNQKSKIGGAFGDRSHAPDAWRNG